MDLLENVASESARHPWEMRRSSLFNEILRDTLAGKAQVDVLDCGAGDGWFSSRLRVELPQVRTITCWDVHYDDAALARFGAQYPSLAFTRSKPNRRFDLIVALDVIEHVEHDVALVRELAEALSPGGRMLVSVPAWQPLFGRHDTFLRHYRRYSPSRCDAVLEEAGLRVLARGGAFHSLVLPRAVSVLCEKAAAKLGHALPPASEAGWSHGKAVTSLVTGMLRVDNAFSRVAARAKLNLPGLSYWAVCAVNA